MTLVPTDEGILGAISKLDEQNPEAAAMLLRIGLFEALQDQLEPLRPQMTTHIYKQMEAVNKRARTVLLRNHVAKAASGDEEPDDTEFAAGLSILDAHIEKGLVGWALSLFNDQHKRNDRGRFVRMQGPSTQGGTGPEDPRQGNMRQDAVDLTSAVLGSTSGQSSRLTRGLFSGENEVQNQSGHANQWYGQTQGTERQAYNRLRLTGSALQQLGQPGSTAHTVGTAANLIGNIGPEAEKVLGPGIRRTAYRYRGTERRPDEAVLLPVQEANQVIRAFQSPDANERARAAHALETAAGARGKVDPVAQIAAREMASQNTSADKKALTIRGNTAVASMLGVGSSLEEEKNLLPDLELTQLSIESGEMPPSQGVIIDSRGNVVTQAVGYNGDHYLPFDLRNLGALYGGQYVRTRATGGPTSEDIYTGLLTGARQIQVVSNSGVFTVEFDPDLRGGRRYNDKVHRMIERYESMLSTIDSGAIYQSDVSPERMKALRQQAVKGARNDEEFNTNLRTLVERERLQGRAGEGDEPTEADQMAEDWVDGQVRTEERKHQQATGQTYSNQQRARLREQKMRDYRRQSNEGTIRRLRLDGEGYSRALKALKQEFPYYIRTATFEPLPQWLESHGLSRGTEERFSPHAPSDLGYVQPGQTNFKRGYQTADGKPLSGFRAARKVPTDAPSRGAAAAAPVATAAAQPQTQEQGAAQTQQQGAQQPQTQAQGAQPQAQQAPTLAQMVAPGGHLYRQAAHNARGFLASVQLLRDPTQGPAGEDDMDDPNDFAVNIARRFNKQADPQSAFTKWFLTEATSQERSKFVTGVNGPGGLFQWLGDFTQTARKEGEITRAFEDFKAVADVVHPYATPDSADPMATEPDEDDPKPIQFPDVPPLEADDEEFEHYISQLAIQNPDLGKAIDQYEGIGDDERATLIKMAINSRDQERMAREQFAWSVNYAREKAALLKTMLPEDGGAAPLVKKSDDRPRRRLIFA